MENNSQDDPYIVALTGGANDATGDFGYYRQAGSIGDLVWDDANLDGIKDPPESGLAGALVSLTIGYPSGDGVTLVQTTGATGAYEFANLLLDEDLDSSAGTTHVLTVTPPAGYKTSHTVASDAAEANDQADDPAGAEPANPAQGQSDNTNDFGFLLTGTVSGHLYIDTNGNSTPRCRRAGLGRR